MNIRQCYNYGYQYDFNKYYYYLVTIRKHQVKDYVNKYTLDAIHLFLKKKINDLYFINWVYELDKYDSLHLHALARTRMKVRYKDNSKVVDFRIHWRQITPHLNDIKKVQNYLRKQAHCKESQKEILTTNDCRHGKYDFVK